MAPRLFDPDLSANGQASPVSRPPECRLFGGDIDTVANNSGSSPALTAQNVKCVAASPLT